MIHKWNDSDNYRQHLKAMEFFSLYHQRLETAKLEKTSGGTPSPEPGNISVSANSPDFFTDENGRIICVPIWDVDLARGSQN